MEDLDVETFLLLVSVVLERAVDDLELTRVVVEPLRTTDVGTKEELYELFCTEIGVSWPGQKESILLEEMRKHRHEEDSSSWKIQPSLKSDCPELGIHAEAICD